MTSAPQSPDLQAERPPRSALGAAAAVAQAKRQQETVRRITASG